jgi:hypothetical protein
MRLGKQIPLDITNEMDICYGTTNRLNPQVIFVNGKFWIEPQIEMEYERVLNSISYNIKNKIRHLLKTENKWDNRVIFDIDIKTTSMSTHRKTFGDFEIFLRQKDSTVVKVDKLGDALRRLLTPIISEFIEDLQINDFIITKTKR